MKEKRLLLRRFTMPLAELEAYYRQKRIRQYEQQWLPNIGLRRRLYPLIAAFLKVDRLVSGARLTCLSANPYKKEHPLVFACTHVGRYDFEAALESIGQSVFLFMGDPGETYRNIDGVMLFLNGRICMDSFDRQDRFISKETSVRILQGGGNILIWPEGAWNTTENLPVMPLFQGTAEMAIRIGADIVPLAFEQYGKEYVVNFGEAISCTGLSVTEKEKVTARLRDCLATLRWEIWEKKGVFSRAALPKDASERYLERIMSETENGYTLEMIYATRYHHRETSPEEVFAFLDRLIPCKENAFLMRR
ncbi:MAG: hypothetical protein LUF30_06675 [Lachnospiraceae bacterium]|nr:hypothetical protein [Lachnospiraceae bacterium]